MAELVSSPDSVLELPKPGSPQPGLIVICGETGIGKSSLALALARVRQTILISADSRQVYRDFDIGTAKPSPADRALVPHFLIDYCDPRHTLTLGDYQQQAQALIAQYHAQGITPILVGGTGLYIKSITQGMGMPRVPPQPQLRSSLESLGQKHCYDLLHQVDPRATARIHPHDAVRTLRALEVFYATGKPMSEQQGETPPPYPILQIGLTYSDRHFFQQRLSDRVQGMWQQGFVAEVQALQQKYGADLPLLKTLGYAEISRFLAGEISETEAQDLTLRHTLQFAKRQRTWFRSIPTLHWLPMDEGMDLVKAVQEQWEWRIEN
jgi:tRNA dimethylallyltransferase